MAEIDRTMELDLISNPDETEFYELRAALVEMLAERTGMDMDTVYCLVYNEGRKIRWS